MKIEKEQICNLVKENNYRNYSFIGKFAEILADNINDYIENGETIEDWFSDYNRGGIDSGFVPQFIYNSDIYPIFEIHYKDLFDWLDDWENERGEEFSLIELNDGGMLPINLVRWAFDWLVDLVYDNIEDIM